MGNIKSRALLYLYFVNLFIKKQSTPHHRDKQRKSRKRAVSNRPKKPILRQPRFCLSIYDLNIDINIMAKIRMGELFGFPVFRRFTDCLVLPGGLDGTLRNYNADFAGFRLYAGRLRPSDSRNIHGRSLPAPGISDAYLKST